MGEPVFRKSSRALTYAYTSSVVLCYSTVRSLILSFELACGASSVALKHATCFSLRTDEMTARILNEAGKSSLLQKSVHDRQGKDSWPCKSLP